MWTHVKTMSIHGFSVVSNSNIFSLYIFVFHTNKNANGDTKHDECHAFARESDRA